MTKKADDMDFPRRYDAEDKIFNLCDVQSLKFTQFITNFDDIEERYGERYLSDDFRDLILDHVSLRKNGNLVHMEHHSVMSSSIMSRNFQFVATLHNASKRLVHPFIFNTGDIPKNTIEFAAPTSFYNPIIVNTQEIEESVRLNNIKYKIDHNEKINIFDIYDLVWMPKYRSDRESEDIVVELSEIYNKLFVDDDLLSFFRNTIILWTGKFVFDRNKIEKIIGELKMTAQEVKLLEQDIIDARIDGLLCRAHDEGISKGERRGEQKVILLLLESMSPEEVSSRLQMPLNDVLEIRDSSK